MAAADWTADGSSPVPRADARNEAGRPYVPVGVISFGVQRSLVLVAGMPGAGKSTLLARIVPDKTVAVVDSQSQRDALGRLLPPGLRYARYRPLVHVLHRMAIVRAAVVGPTVVAVHLPATGVALRTLIALLAALTGRSAHLVWLDVEPAVARRGQTKRGRVVPSACFAAHARRAAATSAALRAGRVPWGYARAEVLSRSAEGSELVALLATAGR